jgi:hypothetical protein
MFLGAPHHSPGGLETSWDRDWNLTTGWKRWLVVAGTQHASFTDLAIFADQLGIDFGATTTGTRSMEITRRNNLAMFDQHLRHRPQPLLGGPSPCYPRSQSPFSSIAPRLHGPFIDRAHARNAIPEQIGTVVTVAAHQGWRRPVNRRDVDQVTPALERIVVADESTATLVHNALVPFKKRLIAVPK